MPCKKCIIKPVHSFDKIGILADGTTSLYYTKPALATEDESPDSINDFIQHFEDTRPNSWFWIFDCKDMKSKNFVSNGSGLKMAKLIQTEYYSSLNGIIVINPSTTMNIFLGIIRPFLKSETKAKIHVCSLGLINIVNKLQSIGSTQKDIQKVITMIQ